MIYFPKEIWTHIFEYDNTYKIQFDKVLKQIKELHLCYRLYIHNYMFHCDINHLVGLEFHNIFNFTKIKNRSHRMRWI